MTPREVAALDPVAYVRRIPPFDLLPEALFLDAARALEIALFEAGDAARRAPAASRSGPLRHPQGRGPAGARRTRAPGARGGRGLRLHLAHLEAGVARRRRGGRAPRVLPPGRGVRAAARPTRGSPLTSRSGSRTASRRASRLPASPGSSRTSASRSSSSCDGPPVWARADATVAEVARVMRDEHVSSVLLRGVPPAIVTDRDLRNRVLGRGARPRDRCDAASARARSARWRRARPFTRRGGRSSTPA